MVVYCCVLLLFLIALSFAQDILKILIIANNQLASVPNAIGHLTALKGLRLDGNQLTSMPNEIGNLVSLQDLSLSK